MTLTGESSLRFNNIQYARVAPPTENQWRIAGADWRAPPPLAPLLKEVVEQPTTTTLYSVAHRWRNPRSGAQRPQALKRRYYGRLQRHWRRGL
jgi:hypothetical protein